MWHVIASNVISGYIYIYTHPHPEEDRQVGRNIGGLYNVSYLHLCYIYIYIYQSKHTRQRLAVATQSFTPVGDLQATDISNLLHAHINKGDI